MHYFAKHVTRFPSNLHVYMLQTVFQISIQLFICSLWRLETTCGARLAQNALHGIYSAHMCRMYHVMRFAQNFLAQNGSVWLGAAKVTPVHFRMFQIADSIHLLGWKYISRRFRSWPETACIASNLHCVKPASTCIASNLHWELQKSPFS